MKRLGSKKTNKEFRAKTLQNNSPGHFYYLYSESLKKGSNPFCPNMKTKLKLEIEFTPCDDSPPGIIYPEDTGISEALKVIGKEIIKVLKKNPGMYVDTVGVKECNRT